MIKSWSEIWAESEEALAELALDFVKKLATEVDEEIMKNTYVCGTCNDTHKMDHPDYEHKVMCTNCPVPCQTCGSGGPYCNVTPCECGCHYYSKKKDDMSLNEFQETCKTNGDSMSLNQFQEKAKETAGFPEKLDIMYCALGLNGEAGEVAEKVKKVIRDNDGIWTSEKEKELAVEISDVMWYAAVLADRIGYTLEEIAQLNIDKLASRQERGTLGGSGDDR